MAGKKRALVGISLLWLLTAFPASAALPVFEQPRWQSLSVTQQKILAPLKAEWDDMDPFRRKKWIGIAQRYDEMTPVEQESIQRNMKAWAKLAPEERKAAREQYKKLKKSTPEQRQVVKQQWEAYSALSEDERDRLRARAPRHPQTKTPAKSMAQSPLSPIKPPQSVMTPKPAVKPAGAQPAARE